MASRAKLLTGLVLTFLTASLCAQEPDCMECHEDVVFKSTAHTEEDCIDCHTNVPPEHEADDLEPLTDEEGCGDCHRRQLRRVERSAHEGETRCAECHGDSHEIHLVAEPASTMSPVNQVKYCGSCHDDPPDLVDGFIASVHGRGLLRSGLVEASPSCSNCHNAHDIEAVDDDKAPTSHANSPEMCGSCHKPVLDEWQVSSAHGMGWAEGSDEVPVCTDCHSSHAIIDPITSEARLRSADTCGDCHEDYLTTFRATFHGQSSDLGLAASATCSDCHTSHANLPADDPKSSVHADHVVETCAKCHEGVTASIASFDPHNDPTDPDDNFAVYVTWLFMTGLLIGVFAFFGIHDALWLQRSMVALLNGEFRQERSRHGPYIRRFNAMNISMHIVIITTFLLLAITGLPLKFHYMPWAQTLIEWMGGIEFTRVIHRLAAIGTFGYLFFHLANLFIRWAFKQEHGLLWGPYSMVPQWRDFKDFFANIRYFLYLGQRPAGDRWTYWEKFDYLAVFWGVVIIGLSGLMLWFPLFFTSFLPGWTLNAAHVVHSDEALLATGFIFIFHFFHTHLRPESFPMDIVVFTGKLPLNRFKAERPLEYQRLVDNNKLDDYLVDAPTQGEAITAYFWGTIFLALGLALAIGIIWALLSH